MKYVIPLLLTLLLVFSCTACSFTLTKGEANEDPSSETVVNIADPQAAIDEIYSNIERQTGLQDANIQDVTKVIGISKKQFDEYYIRYMDADFGASDVYIIKPKEGMEDSVCQSLKDWQEKRSRHFKGYDIYNSYSISENAVIFIRGDYVVMLMLEDNDSAREIIEKYIPETSDKD